MSASSFVNRALSRTAGVEIRRVGNSTPASKTKSRSGDRSKPAKKSSENQRSLGSRSITAPLPVPLIPPGGAKASNFFDDYPKFFGTSRTTPQRIRLNLRYEAIFGQNRDLFDGARVLDIASHDGRWSFAALQTGAAEVIGIEARPDLVENANATFAHYDVAPDRYRFITGDLFEAFEQEAFDVDVVLCLGFMYHTLRYNELLSHIANCRPKALIVDSRIIVSDDSLVFVRTEPAADQRNAVTDRYSRGDRVLTGRPSATAIATMVGAYGFDVERQSDWAALLRDNEIDDSIAVYQKGQRVTLRCRSRSATE